MTDKRVTVDDGLSIWQARDVYRVQGCLLSVFYVPQALCAVGAVLALASGQWPVAVACAVWILLIWVVKWVLCEGAARMVVYLVGHRAQLRRMLTRVVWWKA